MNDAVIPLATGSAPVLAGSTWYFQTWFRDHIPAATSNFTTGWRSPSTELCYVRKRVLVVTLFTGCAVVPTAHPAS
ncbi:MAG: hypothetical protein R3F17_12940 [Planctomycetota bacterium]